MANENTRIGWTNRTWNPTTGCSRISEGCRNCYAAALAPRLAAMGQKGYTKLPWTARNAAENVQAHPDRLEKPLRWKPTRIFVDSMSDLFHEQIPDGFIDQVFAVMALCPRHTFQVLTKRPERMANYLSGSDRYDNWAERISDAAFRLTGDYPIPEPPLANVWLGVSVEDQRAADERIPHLLGTPAAIRFLSCEPLLGDVDLELGHEVAGEPLGATRGDMLHWAIAGGESGPRHRTMDLAWIRALRDQCVAAGVAFWAKQNSGYRPETELPPDLRIREFPDRCGAAGRA